METIDVKETKGVYTVFLSPGSFKPAKFHGEEPPIDGIPSTFLSLEDLKACYRGKDFNIVGEPMQENIKTTHPISDDELAHVIDTKNRVVGKISQLVSYNVPSLNPIAIHDCDKCMEVFSLAIISWKTAKGKKKDLAKEYCNGMAKILLIFRPDLKDKLASIACDNKREDDLL